MPVFGPGELRTARYSLTNPSPAAIVCDVEIYLDSQGGLSESDLCIQANSISHQTYYDFIMPSELGTYHMRIKACGKEIPIEPIEAGEVTIAPPAPQLYEYYNTGDRGSIAIYGKEWKAQTFTPATAHKITSVKLKLLGYLPGTVTVSIRATDGSGHSTGEDLCVGTIDGNTLPTDPEWREITLGSGANLSADTQYAIVVRAPDGTSTKWLGWRFDARSPTYVGGCSEYSSNSGIAWGSDTIWDFMFEEWGVAIAPPAVAQRYEYYNIGDNTYTTVHDPYWLAQTFTPSIVHRITKVKLKLYKYGSPGAITVGIRATDANGKPTGPDLCVGTTDGNTLTEDYDTGEWREIELGAGYILNANTKYAIVVRISGGHWLYQFVGWRYDSAIGGVAVYPSGCFLESGDSGSSWTDYYTDDFMFEEWGKII